MCVLRQPLAETKLLDAEQQAGSEAESQQGEAKRQNKKMSASRSRSPSPAAATPAAKPVGGSGGAGSNNYWPFFVVCLALASQSMAHSVGSTLWPLFVRDQVRSPVIDYRLGRCDFRLFSADL